jgi:L-alanine-DL-glutamate epimerase-like enolase superfamily enzyme
MNRPRHLTIRAESWPLRTPFNISRGSKTVADVVVVEINEGPRRGRGECVPYPRYAETVTSVISQVSGIANEIELGMSRSDLGAILPAGAARSAVDCALWDLEAKAKGCRVWDLAGCIPPVPLDITQTISLDTAEAMTSAAALLSARPVLKVKVGAEGVVERLRAIRAAAPRSRIVVDANEAWTLPLLDYLSPLLAAIGVVLIEQPLPATDDAALDRFDSAVPLCADESCHITADLEQLPAGYRWVNVKLDKAGGLTEALRLTAQAKKGGRKMMIGCMVSTSLAIAPATLLVSSADIVDLDGPQWLARDRAPSLLLADGRIAPPDPTLWG